MSVSFYILLQHVWAIVKSFCWIKAGSLKVSWKHIALFRLQRESERERKCSSGLNNYSPKARQHIYQKMQKVLFIRMDVLFNKARFYICRGFKLEDSSFVGQLLWKCILECERGELMTFCYYLFRSTSNIKVIVAVGGLSNYRNI